MNNKRTTLSREMFPLVSKGRRHRAINPLMIALRTQGSEILLRELAQDYLTGKSVGEVRKLSLLLGKQVEEIDRLLSRCVKTPVTDRSERVSNTRKLCEFINARCDEIQK